MDFKTCLTKFCPNLDIKWNKMMSNFKTITYFSVIYLFVNKKGLQPFEDKSPQQIA